MKEGLLLIRLVESFYGNLLPKILVVGGKQKRAQVCSRTLDESWSFFGIVNGIMFFVREELLNLQRGFL